MINGDDRGHLPCPGGSVLTSFLGPFHWIDVPPGVWIRAHFTERETETRRRGCHMRWIRDLNAVQHRRPKSILSFPVRPGCQEDGKEGKRGGHSL